MLDQLQARRRDETHCEAVLWDLAGQPDYRLIHALHVSDADLALLLFDPTHRDPLSSVHYWLGQLPRECPKILVPARVDRGSPTLTDAELEAFCITEKITGGFVKTSAADETGLDALLDRMKAQIPWDTMTAVTTTATFKRIKDFVMALKEDRDGKQIIVTPGELRRLLESSEPKKLTFSDAEMLTAAERVASHGYVRFLKNSGGEQRILLVPELLNNLAASFIVEARRNPGGFGAIEEDRVLDNRYGFRELEGLDQLHRDLLVDATIGAFLENRLTFRCFRERVGAIQLLVFPELMNLKKPETDVGPLVEDHFYAVTGATVNTYASLVVSLGYTNAFQRADQWKHNARYEYASGLFCGFRRDEEDGETTYTLYYSEHAADPVKHLFQGLFETNLAQQPLLKVLRFEPVKCECATLLDCAVMRKRLDAGKDFAFCEECGEKLALPPADEPIRLTQEVSRQVSDEERASDQRAEFEKMVYQLKSKADAEERPKLECFISYAWRNPKEDADEPKVEVWVAQLADDLRNAGFPVFLDQTDNADFGADISRFVDKVTQCDRVLVVGTPRYLTKYENKNHEKGSGVAAEMDQINLRLRGTEKEKRTVIPLLLSGSSDESFPPALRGKVRADFRDSETYLVTTFDVMLSLYDYSKTQPGIRDWREALVSA